MDLDFFKKPWVIGALLVLAFVLLRRPTTGAGSVGNYEAVAVQNNAQAYAYQSAVQTQAIQAATVSLSSWLGAFTENSRIYSDRRKAYDNADAAITIESIHANTASEQFMTALRLAEVQAGALESVAYEQAEGARQVAAINANASINNSAAAADAAKKRSGDNLIGSVVGSVLGPFSALGGLF